MSEILSKETVLDIIKSRRTYGHEAEALGREVLALREERDLSKPMTPAQIADMLKAASFMWGGTPQGYNYWLTVYENLKALKPDQP